MSRNASGTYTLPAGNPVVSGTDITVTWGNTTMSDVATEMTDSVSRSGKGGMLAPLTLADGTAGVPGLSWSSDTNSGFYRIGADNVGLSLAGAKVVDYAAGSYSFIDTAVTATVGPIFSIFRDSASPADADFIGEIRFDGEDDGSVKTTYAAISGQIDDVTGATEDGTLLVKTMTAGTLTTQLDISSAAVVVTPPTTLTGAVTATGGITSGGDILSDTDSTDSLGSTAVRWLKGWFDTLTAGTLTIGAGTITDSSGAISFGNENLTTTGNVDANGVEFDSLSGTGAVAITDIKDEDNMASDSATMLATQQSIKAYVDAQVDTVDTLSEVLAIGNTTSGTDVSVTTTDKVQFRDAAIYINSSVDGQLDIVADTEIQIAATTVDINGAINASGEIIAASLDISGDIDVDGTSNLDIVDIDGAVNMATTALVTGVLTTTATQVATGGITSGSNIISDTDSTDSLGSTTVRWLKGWFDTLTAGTLTIGGGTITDSSGAITFGNENLVTTGTLGSGALTATTGTFSGDVSVGGTALISDSTTHDVLSIGVATGASHGQAIKLINSGSTNFQISSNYQVGNSFAISRSTAAGGTTFTNNDFIIDSSGNATFAGSLTAQDTIIGSTISGALSSKLQVTQDAGVADWTAAFQADTTSGASYGLKVHGGSTAADTALYVRNAANTTTLFEVDGVGDATFAGDVTIGPNTATGTKLIMDGTSPQIDMNRTSGSASSRNWSARVSEAVEGSYSLYCGTSNGASPSVEVVRLDSAYNATFAGDVSVGGGTGAWLTAWKDNSNSGNQFLIGDTEGVNAAIRTYSTSDPAGLIMNYYYAVAGSPYLRYADIVSNQGTGAAAGIRLITKNAANAYSATVIDGDGNATFTGSISKASGSFKIPHPLPELNETHNLVHSFVESPRAENLYSGMVNLVDGTASVNIDTHSGMTEGTFEALNTLLTHSSSNEGGYSPVKCSVVGNVITINCQDATSTDKVYWEVRGERKDQHMLDTEWTDDEGHVIVEPLKDVVEAVVEEVVENV
jgi:hypothetical protein